MIVLAVPVKKRKSRNVSKRIEIILYELSQVGTIEIRETLGETLEDIAEQTSEETTRKKSWKNYLSELLQEFLEKLSCKFMRNSQEKIKKKQQKEFLEKL